MVIYATMRTLSIPLSLIRYDPKSPTYRTHNPTAFSGHVGGVLGGDIVPTQLLSRRGRGCICRLKETVRPIGPRLISGIRHHVGSKLVSRTGRQNPDSRVSHGRGNYVRGKLRRPNQEHSVISGHSRTLSLISRNMKGRMRRVWFSWSLKGPTQ